MSFVLTKEMVDTGLENVQDFINTLFKEKYCQEGETTKQDVLDRIANIVEQKGKEFGYDKIKEYSLKEAADLIRNEYFVPGGSILAGLGKKDSNSSLSNCYVVPIENDSIEAIWDAAGKMARTYSYRGGCGTDITVLRPANTPVHNAAKSSSGAVSFMPFLSTTTKTIGQAGRRGALLISIDCRHPDVMSFIWSKADPQRVFPIDALDTEIPSVSRANISVKLTDEFMRAVKDDKPWHCLFPDIDTNKELYNKEWDGDYEKWLEIGGTLKKYDTYKAIVTEENRHRFIGQILYISNPTGLHEWYRLVSDQEYIRLTYHEDEIGDIPIDHINNLEIGKEYTFKIPTAKQIMQNMAEAACMRGDPGVMFIDHMQNNTYGTKVSPETKIKTTNPCFTGDTLVYTDEGPKTFFELSHAGIANVLSYKNGKLCFKRMTNIRKTRERVEVIGIQFLDDSVVRCTPDHNFFVQTLDQSNDLNKKIEKVEAQNLINYFNDVETNYGATLITPNNSKAGKPYFIKSSSIPSKDAPQFIEDVYCGMVEDTNCFFIIPNGTNPSEQNSTMPVLVSNCGELALPAWNSCLLGAHVLSKYVVNPWSDKPYLDLELFQKNTQLAVMIMDIFSEINQELHPLENQRYFDKRTRRLGIEFLGLADMVSMLKLKLDTTEACNCVSDLMLFKAYLELIASNKLAKYLHAPEILHPIKNKKGISDLLNSEYITNILNKSYREHTHVHRLLDVIIPETRPLIKDIKKYGLRNIGLNTVGPTGSLALICNNASSGIEPIFSLYQKRRTRVGDKLEYELVHAPLMSHLKQYYSHELAEKGFTLQELKERFCIREAYEINYKDRIELQSVVQKWTDGSISSTVNLPETCTVDDIVNIYTYAWDKKLKGITVYRAGSLTGVIETKTEDKLEDKNIITMSKDSDCVGNIPVIRELNDVERCRRHRVIWNKTKIYITVTIDEQNKPIEVFAALPKEVGIDENDIFSSQSYQEKDSLWTAVCRLTSLALRANLPLEEIIKQLQKSSYVLNDPMAILIRVLSTYVKINISKDELKEMSLDEINQNDFTTICPQCNQKTYVREAGCAICYNPECQYTKCS